MDNEHEYTKALFNRWLSEVKEGNEISMKEDVEIIPHYNRHDVFFYMYEAWLAGRDSVE